MFKKIIVLFTLYLMNHSGFCQLSKTDINNFYQKRIAFIEQQLGSYCSSEASNLFMELESAHQLFLNDHALDAVLTNINTLEKIDAYQRPMGCNFSVIAGYMIPKLYMQYYLDDNSSLNNNYEVKVLTDEERSDLKNSYKFAHDILISLCKKMKCSYRQLDLLGQFEVLEAEILHPTPDYMKLLRAAMVARMLIISSYLDNETPDELYYTAISKINQNMRIMFLIPKKYLYDLKEKPLFRDQYLLKMVEYMMNTEDNYSMSYLVLTSYFSFVYYEEVNNEYIELISDTMRFFEAYTVSSVKNKMDKTIEPWIFKLPYEFSKETKNLIMKLKDSTCIASRTAKSCRNVTKPKRFNKLFAFTRSSSKLRD